MTSPAVAFDMRPHEERFAQAVAECVVAVDRLARDRSEEAFSAWRVSVEMLRALWLARPKVGGK